MVIFVNLGDTSIMEAMPDADRTIDITGDLCPMTFVKTRIALDRMAPGQILLIRLRGDEPERNVPRTAIEQGHAVLDRRREADGTLLLLLRKGG